ncbi:hypothetical protein [Methylobacterium tarhaniae]|uniref:hypothetical protein n=1 Tax=Methylobacterium tarhaniae TaxID=1187852 RepID=UPI0012ED06BD|nr:hypothetical protein [Methylobacterium tarhaniae]
MNSRKSCAIIHGCLGGDRAGNVHVQELELHVGLGRRVYQATNQYVRTLSECADRYVHDPEKRWIGQSLLRHQDHDDGCRRLTSAGIIMRDGDIGAAIISSTYPSVLPKFVKAYISPPGAS